MKRFTHALGALLAVQVGLVAWFTADKPNAKDVSNSPLISVSPDQVERLVIASGDEKIELAKIEGQWQLESTGLPVLEEKVESLLDQWTSAQLTSPVVTKNRHHERFQVAEVEYFRRVELHTADGESQTLFFGTSPALKRTHVRPEDDDAIYDLAFNRHDLDVFEAQWLDTALLQPETLQGLSWNQWHIAKNGDQWQWDMPSDFDTTLSDSQLDTLVAVADDLAKLSVIRSVEPEFLENATPVRSLHTVGDVSYQYDFYDLADGTYVTRNDYPRPFKITEKTYQSLAAFSLTPETLATGDEQNVPETQTP